MSTEPADGSPRNPYRVNAPEDILSLIPHTLGFEPRNSLVLMALCGGRLGATLRLDLPPGPGQGLGQGQGPASGSAKARANAEYAAAACRFLASDTEADGALLAVYTDAPWTDPAHPPYRPLVRRLEKALRGAGIPLQDGWLVGPDTWRDYFCIQPDCCPWPGTPRSRIADSMLNTELVYRGSAFAASLERAVAESFPGQWPTVEEVAGAQARFTGQAAGRWCERDQFRRTLGLWAACLADAGLKARGAEDDSADAVGDADSGTPPYAEDDSADAVADADSGAPPYAEDALDRGAGHGVRPPHRDAECAGFLLASLGDRGIRDALLVLAAVGKDAAVAGAEANGLVRRQVHPLVLPAAARPGPFFPDSNFPDKNFQDSSFPNSGLSETGAVPLRRRTRKPSKAAAEFRSILVGRGMSAPDWTLLDRAHAVFTDLVPAADREARAALLSLLAWMEWARGRGSRADVYLQHALEACPGYRLALLLRELVGTGILPDWARSRDGAWPGPPDD